MHVCPHARTFMIGQLKLDPTHIDSFSEGNTQEQKTDCQEDATRWGQGQSQFWVGWFNPIH